MTLTEQLQETDSRIAAEEARIAEGVEECRRTGTSLHDGYWKRLWALRQRREMVVRVMEVFRDGLQ